jgi:hypothetical protein
MTGLWGYVAKDEGLWLHVDGAYGASIALSDKHRHLVDGIGRGYILHPPQNCWREMYYHE